MMHPYFQADVPHRSPPADLANNLGLAEQCWHLANAVCDVFNLRKMILVSGRTDRGTK